MLSVGMLFHDRYELKRQLGRGGFSEVWLALDTKVNHDVAVKVYAPGTGLDDEAVTLFMQEFSLVYDLNHTNLLKPTTYDDWDNVPYLILPYCRQGSIYKFVSRGERISEDQCWHLLHDVAAGLAFLHEQVPPIIHRDIKPDNILISDNGNYMITDFGISASIRKTIHRSSAEQSTGTLAYMAPELFSTSPKPVMASDIWALGATMFEVMTADIPPFGNHGGLIQRNGGEIPTIDEPYSDELKDIIYQCLAKEPWDRPRAHDIEKLTYEHIEGISDTLRPGRTLRSSNPQPAPAPQPAPVHEPSPQPEPSHEPTPQPAPVPQPAPDPQQESRSTVSPSTPPPAPQPESAATPPQQEEETAVVDKPKKKRKKKKKPQNPDGQPLDTVMPAQQPQPAAQPASPAAQQAQPAPRPAPHPTVEPTTQPASSPNEPQPVLYGPPVDYPQPEPAKKSLPIAPSAKFPWVPLAITSAAALLLGVLLHVII